MYSSSSVAPSHTAVADSMLSPFAALSHQPRVCAYFEAALREGKLSHAYLFYGGSETDKKAAAQALAYALMCPQQACMNCDDCRLLAQASHPDVHQISPEGSAGYLIGQLKELIHDVTLRPVRSEKKLYIIERAELLSAVSANALLKTLEEPPSNTVFILLAAQISAVLPTIVSRCQLIPFAAPSAGVLSDIRADYPGLEEHELQLAWALTHDTAELRAYASSDLRRRTSARLFDILLSLHEYDGWQLLKAAQELCEAVQLPAHELKGQFEAQLKESEEYLFKQGSKRLAEMHKRELSARERSGMIELVAVAEYVVQELLVIRVAGTVSTMHSPYAERLSLCARSTSEAGIMRAYEACRQARDSIARNVTAQLVCETMLISIKEALTCPPSSLLGLPTPIKTSGLMPNTFR